MQVHHRGVAPGRIRADRLAVERADRAEDVGGGVALVGGAEAAAAPCPWRAIPFFWPIRA